MQYYQEIEKEETQGKVEAIEQEALWLNINEVLLLRYVSEIEQNWRCEALRRQE